MKKILCPTDFSEASHTAIAYAAKLAQAINGELTLLNVQSIFDLAPLEILSGKESGIKAASAQLEAQSVEVSKAFKISCNAEVESSIRKLSNVIHDRARQFDLIVMGTDGPDDLYQFFTGSNTYNALVKAETPLLLIPSGYVYTEIKKMVYAFDYLHERNLPLAHLLPFVKAVKCELTVLQVIEDIPNKKTEDDLKELQFMIRNLYGDDIFFHYDTVRSAEIAQSINSYVLRNQPDALALCSVHRNLLQRIFHKSIIKAISVVSSYPVFVFHK